MSSPNHLDWLCCKNPQLQQQTQQELLSQRYFRPTSNLVSKNMDQRNSARPTTSKPVYSFKDNLPRVRSDEKNTTSQQSTLRQWKSNQKCVQYSPFLKQNEPKVPVTKANCHNFDRKQVNSPRIIKIRQFTSPQSKVYTNRISNQANPDTKHLKLNVHQQNQRDFKSPSKLYSNLYSLTIKPEKPIFKFNPKIRDSRFKEKRIKTAEEETQYSSRQSQVYFRNSYEGSQSTGCHSFQKKNLHGQSYFRSSVFQQDNQRSEINEKVQFPSCQQVPACQEFDHSISNQYLRNARSINSIVTSTEMKSKRTSREPSNLMNLRLLQNLSPSLSPRQSQGTPSQGLTLRNNASDMTKQQRFSTRCQTKTPKSFISPVKKTTLGHVEEQLQGQRVNSSIFYIDETIHQKPGSKKVSYLSVLNIHDEESSQDQELKDVVDSDINISKGFSGDNSIFTSARQSLKNVEERRQRRILIPQIEQFREQDLQLLKEMRSRQKRTNTIFSVDSVPSQNSMVDIKFMQKHRTRREVSKLIRE